MARLVFILGMIVLLPIVGCGSDSKTQSTMPSQAPKGQVQTTSCGANGGIAFKLHNVDCEIANTLIVLLDGRALHQAVILEAEGKRRGAWVCTSPTRALTDQLHCRHGGQFFTVTPTQ